MKRAFLDCLWEPLKGIITYQFVRRTSHITLVYKDLRRVRAVILSTHNTPTKSRHIIYTLMGGGGTEWNGLVKTNYISVYWLGIQIKYMAF